MRPRGGTSARCATAASRRAHVTRRASQAEARHACQPTDPLGCLTHEPLCDFQTGDVARDCAETYTGVDADPVVGLATSNAAPPSAEARFVSPSGSVATCKAATGITFSPWPTGSASVSCSPGSFPHAGLTVKLRLYRTFTAGPYAPINSYYQERTAACAAGASYCSVTPIVTEYTTGAVYEAKAEITIRPPTWQRVLDPTCRDTLAKSEQVTCHVEEVTTAGVS